MLLTTRQEVQNILQISLKSGVHVSLEGGTLVFGRVKLVIQDFYFIPGGFRLLGIAEIVRAVVVLVLERVFLGHVLVRQVKFFLNFSESLLNVIC